MLETQGVTPFLLVPDLKDAMAFYGALGFECTFLGDADGYAFMASTGGGLRLLENAQYARQEGLSHMVYVDVPDIDAFWADKKDFLETLPTGNVRAPFDQPYKQREVHVIGPGGLLIFFGQDIRE